MTILSSDTPDPLADVAEPTDAELRAIEAEWPSIETDLIELDLHILLQALKSEVTVTTRRRNRRRGRRVLGGTSRMAVAS